MRALSDPLLDEPGYARAISTLYGFWLPHLPATDPALRRLGTDLSSLEISPDTLPRMPKKLVLPIQDTCHQLARDYLLLGSSLGGALICRRLTTRFGASWVTTHASHFASSDGNERQRWQAYLLRLATIELTGEQEDRLINAAIKMFASLRLWSLETPPVQLRSSATSVE